MIITALLVAAVLLSIERISYALIWHRPEVFRALCAHPLIAPLGAPVDVLQKLFYVFKFVQLSVFAGWCLVFAEGAAVLPSGGPVAIMAGSLLLLVGQVLNFGVFYQLGKVGVFYGSKLGHEVAWCNDFPFSIVRHPQYVGALLSVWGFFMIMRFPHPDWVVLPLLQSVYYALAAYAES